MTLKYKLLNIKEFLLLYIYIWVDPNEINFVNVILKLLSCNINT